MNLEYNDKKESAKNRPLHILRKINISIVDILCLSACIGSFSAWIISVASQQYLSIILINFVICTTALLYGAVIVRSLHLSPTCLNDFPAKFLLGFFLVSSLLFFCVVVIRFTIVTGFYFTIGILAAIITYEVAKEQPIAAEPINSFSLVPFFCVAACLVGTSLWFRDCFNPVLFSSDSAIIKPWRDFTYHTAAIRELGLTDGVPLEHSIMAGLMGRFYHFGSYMASGLLKALTDVSSFDLYNAFLVPAGLFLSSISVYAMVGSWWGVWPGFAASVFLLLLPDASYYGFADQWFGYHWLLSISPGLSYAISLMAISWALLLEGIRTSRKMLVVISYMMAAICIIYKSQILVAVSFPFVIYPFVFWRNLSTGWKVSAILLVTLLFAGSIHICNKLPFCPFIILDYSAMNSYLDFVTRNISAIHIRDVVLQILGAGQPLKILTGSMFVLFATFGLLTVAYPALALYLRSQIRKEILLFPCFVIATYIIMSLGLAYDKHHIGTPEELLHRPFVWGYFVVCSWVSGLVYMKILGNDIPGRRSLAVLSIAFVGLSMASFTLGHRLQVGPAWGNDHSWLPVPSGLVHACFFIRDNTSNSDIIQDSMADPTVYVSALSDRPEFFIDVLSSQPDSPRLLERKAKLEKLKALSSTPEIANFAADCGIRWYLMRPDDVVRWPAELLLRPEYEWEGYRVFKLW